jgi:phenylpropionate dioxygenase-like ring-hydroxylating dioxygenase large terminal subunit
MYVRNCWYVAAWDYELKPGELISRTILGEPIVLYRARDGGLVALADRCCHRFAPLSLGRIEGDDLRCMYHGLKFDRSGRCIEIPGQDMIPQTACVRTYPAVEAHSWIWVWMGEEAKAEAALIPPAVGLDDPHWTLRSGHLDYEANYLLINDNLTDFTHLSYVHANSFGATEAFARTRPTVERLERGVRIWRWLSDGLREDAPTRVHRRGEGDNWQSYDFLAPGELLMHTVVCPFGTAERFGQRPPDLSQVEVISENFTSQAVTPTTERTSRYFFSWGPRSGEGADVMAGAMMELALMAFGEDKTMIEAQQRVIDMGPEQKEVLTSADVGPMQMRAALQRLIKAEREDAAASAA